MPVSLQEVSDRTEPLWPDGSPTAISGTRLFAAISVMEGGPHSQSSMFEALYYSMLFICSDGQQPRRPALGSSMSLQQMCQERRAFMQQQPRPQEWGVHQQHAAFISALHLLFSPPTESKVSCRNDVTMQEFTATCAPFAAEL